MSQLHNRRLSSRSRLARKLAAYAATAGLAATASDKANASIVFTNLGPGGITASNSSFDLDFDNDGNIDFSISHVHRSEQSESGRWSYNAYRWVAQRQNRVMRDGLSVVRNLNTGSFIGPQQFSYYGASVLWSSSHSNWCNSTRSCGTRTHTTGNFGHGNASGYLGLQFDISQGSNHMGWAHVSLIGSGVRVDGFAYETEPGTPILAGDAGIPPNVPGDTNGDGKVDLEDLNNVRSNFSASGGGIRGDTNNDDVVDLQDLNAVRNNFGAGNPVPEPPSLLLLAAGAAGLAVLRKKRGAAIRA